jgi:tetratricopeptide (TPR) repeat protein
MAVGQYGDAIRFFDRAVEADSGYRPAWISLGASLALAGGYERADSILQYLYTVDSAVAFQMLDVIDQEAARWKESEK